MPFDLKNVGATYQRAMVTLFHDMMYKEIEVYVDDVIANARAIEWDDDCQKAIDDIKTYLVQSSVLVPPTPGRPLIRYLTVRQQSLGCMLGQEDEFTRAEHAIYYLSKKFTEGESNYPEIEKMRCALVWVMQRLRQYTLYHTIRLLSKVGPLKYILGSPSSMRNIAKRRYQLMEYDVEYIPRTSVKGQAIADHLAEFPIEDDTPINSDFPDEEILQVDEEEDGTAWKMYFDGAVNSTGSDAEGDFISREDIMNSGDKTVEYEQLNRYQSFSYPRRSHLSSDSVFGSRWKKWSHHGTC
ncbi:hypothetical protein CRG98_014886 [Punica granatum]|uniref:Reverse transcriptase/retrotransposon-derived protein RNase H-like domain-containing protein n=1 Tax=Punica granatum TaxID=22663 RepID=A0A2I0K899_PUNGR|nr:hypothetical protein CRG98_014886 [Punica granatum]